MRNIRKVPGQFTGGNRHGLLLRVPKRILVGGTFALAIHASTAYGQAFPVKPIRITVPFAVGGGVDITARLLSQGLSERLSQSVIVENRASATGISALEHVAKSAPDGYNLLVSTQTTQAVLPAIYENLAFDVARDFLPITQIANSPLLLVVNTSLPIKSVGELIEYAKRQSTTLTFGAATGATTHLAGEMFKRLANVHLTFIPYKGEGPAISDAIGGHISMVFSTLPGGLPQVRGGKLRALATTSADRIVTAQEIPTVNESGVPGYEASVWYGMFAPNLTPRAIVQRLSQESSATLSVPSLKERMANDGIFVVGSTPENFANFLKSEVPKWSKVVKEIGLKPQ